jgi:hypothetical protein
MQTKIANYGGPLGHNVAIDSNGTGAVINFLGELQSADTLGRCSRSEPQEYRISCWPENPPQALYPLIQTRLAWG